MEFRHVSVLFKESIEALKIKSDGIYADGTLGGGGHSHQAGVTVSCGLEEAQKLVLPLLISLIENK